MTSVESPKSIMPSTDAPAFIRISTVVGDRLCIRCGFNLHGQPIVREPVYQLLIAQCPECGTPAALQEYPALGRWAGRWAALLAVAWLLILVGAIFVTGGTVAGMTHAAGESAARTLAVSLGERHQAWLASPAGERRREQRSGWGYGAYSMLSQEWIETGEHRVVLHEAGGPLRALDWRGTAEIWLWMVFLCGMLGLCWSVFLLARPRWQVAIFMLLPAAFALLLVFYFRSDYDYGWGWRYAHQFGASLLWPWPLFFSFIIAGAALGTGIGTGRHITRFLARVLLPPRMASSLDFLWIIDGRDPPRPRRQEPPPAG
jgi:hypothetical protein